MKLRSTTSLPSSSVKRAAVIGVAVVIGITAVTLPMQIRSNDAGANNFDARIQALERRISQYEDEANRLRERAGSIQGEIDRLAAERSEVQARIELTREQRDRLVAEIEEIEERIETNRRVSGDLIVSSSVDGDIPLIVRLAGSTNLADYIDGETNRMAARDAIVEATRENEVLRDDLEERREEVEQVLSDETALRNSLQRNEAEQARLLNATEEDEAEYRSQIRESASERDRLQDEQRRLNAQAVAGAGGGGMPAPTGGTGNYPYIGGWSGNFSPRVDPWGFYYQQCTSYVAWKIHDTKGHFPMWGRNYQPANAADWLRIARGEGYTVNNTPAVGAAGVTTVGPYGHVVYVEAVNGSTITVSDYNLGFDGAYRQYQTSASSFQYIHF